MATHIASVVQAGSPAHRRQHDSLLAGVEKRVLVWMAERLPKAVNSDHLTALGLASMFGVGLAFWLAAWYPTIALPLVPVLLAVNWFGDSLDGTLARVRQRQRPRYGFYVDHVIDLVGSVALFAGLAASGFMDPRMALGALTAFLLVSAESYLATHSRGVFNMSFLGWGPTEMRILVAIGAVRLVWGASVTPLGFGPFRLFDLGGAIAIAGLAIAFIALTARNARSLYEEETTW